MELARVAAAFFREQACDLVLHLGDVTRASTMAAFGGLPITIVRGNNDAPTMGVPAWESVVAGVRVYAHHGHEPARPSAEPDLLVHGHSHRMRRERAGRTLVVNPGALQRAAVKTIALVELPELDVRFFEVRPGGARALA